jgi:hypothetical protein
MEQVKPLVVWLSLTTFLLLTHLAGTGQVEAGQSGSGVGVDETVVGSHLSSSVAQPHVAQASSSQGNQAVPVAAPPQTPGVQLRPGTGMGRAVESTPLEDLLLEKGVISQEDWLRIKAEEERRTFERLAEGQFRGSPRWFERININGYMQFRYSTRSESRLTNQQGESFSNNNNGDFFFRRIRMVFQGQMSDRVSFFLQLAHEGNGFSTATNEMVDAYGDYYLTKDKEHRIRFGLHRVPNSFDTYRSSSQRQELDRSEAIQTGSPGERDLGLAYYWSPKIAQERFATLTTYHNGPGDYGVFGLMVYNGQGRNQVERNRNKHFGAKLAYPFELPNGRLLETGLFAFTGIFNVQNVGAPTSTTSSSRCQKTLENGGCEVQDQRVTAYVWTPPQPWGFMGEYTVGRGPERDGQGFVSEQELHGGYAQANYTWRYSDVGQLTPYVRYSYYHGGMKNFQGAAADNKMWNFGLVLEPDTHLRLVTEYSLHDRLDTSSLTVSQPQLELQGHWMRFQIQWFFN